MKKGRGSFRERGFIRRIGVMKLLAALSMVITIILTMDISTFLFAAPDKTPPFPEDRPPLKPTDLVKGKNPAVFEAVYSAVYSSKGNPGIQIMITSGSFPSEPEVGGFTIEVDGMIGDHLEVDKVYHDTSELSNVSMAKIGLQNVEITGLNLYKNLTLEDGGQMYLRIRTKNPNDKVIISGEGFLSNHLEVFTSEMYAKKLIAKVLFLPIVLNDYWSTAPEEDLLIRLGGTLRVPIEADRMKLNTHVLTAKRITIPNMVLEIGEGHLASNIP